VDERKKEKERERVTNEERGRQDVMEREEGETVRYRVPEAPWVRSRLEGLSQSPIDHGIQPVHDPMTLTIKLGKTCAKKECESTKDDRSKERKKERERTSWTP